MPPLTDVFFLIVLLAYSSSILCMFTRPLPSFFLTITSSTFLTSKVFHFFFFLETFFFFFFFGLPGFVYVPGPYGISILPTCYFIIIKFHRNPTCALNTIETITCIVRISEERPTSYVPFTF